jgi:putative ABC transport system permease protein
VAIAPGVDAASFAMVDPLRDQCGTGVRVIGADGAKRPEVLAGCDDVGPDYFRAMQIPILYGRAFTRADIEGKQNVVVVDEAFAKAHFGNSNPIGQRFVAAMEEVEIIGVARAIRPLDPGSRFPTKVYRPMRAPRSAKLLVSYRGAYSDVDRAVRAGAAALDGNVTVRTHSIEENIGAALLPVRLAATGAWAMGGFALLLAVAGIYGVVDFAVSRKRREVGIRVALGARRSNILRVVVWQGLKPAVIGAVAGLVCAALAARLLEAMLYGISPLDPVAFVSMPLLVTTIAAVAAILPARAALRVDPAITLRYD